MTHDRKPSPAQLTDVQIKEFMAGVVPWPAKDEPGYITIHWKGPGKKGFFGRSCRTIDAALQFVSDLKNTQVDIYFCTSSQKLNNGRRDRAHAIGLVCVPIDIDIDPNDPKKYPTLPEAIAALLRFCIQHGIPRPSFLVGSGGGLHVYWISDRVLTVEEWQVYADAIKQAAMRAGLKFDRQCTGDAARVLRVPGTLNWKYGDPRPVRLLPTKYATGERYDFAAVFGKILSENKAPHSRRQNKKPAPAQLNIEVAPAFKHLDPKVGLADGIVFDDTPLPFDPIKAECGWLRCAHETGGKDHDQPQWHLMVLAMTFIENGHELAHQLSNQHSDYGHGEKTEEMWDRKVRERAEKNIGWPSCRAIRDAQPSGQPSVCDQCPHFKKGKSPLHLALQQHAGATLSATPLPFINFADWDHEPLPEYEWSVPLRYPLRQTVLSTGEGAVGKSIVKLQLAVAHALGRDWLNAFPAPGPAIFVDAEDDAKVLHIRLAAILRHYGATFADAVKGGLHLVSLVGHDAVMGAPTRSGKIEPTALYNQLLEAAGDIKPKTIVIASSADVFAGNEIDRSQVRQFVSLLTRIAIAANGTVSLIAHPSLTGINTGTGLSGNTAWHNSVRARDYMTNIKPSENGEQPDTDLRQIIFKKNQYGPVAETIVLRYRDGLYLPEAGVGVDRAARQLRTDEIFLELLHRLRSENRYVSANKSAAYAPAIFAREDVARKARLNSADFAGAMVRLFEAKKICNDPYGKPSRPSYRIAPTTAAANHTATTDPSEEG